MEHEPTRSDVEPNTEREPGAEVVRPTLEALPTILGLVETEAMQRLGQELTAAYTSGSGDTKSLANRYQLLAEAVIDAIPGDNSKARLGLEIRLALIRRDAGLTDQYLEDLGFAAYHAYTERYGDLAELLDGVIRDTKQGT